MRKRINFKWDVLKRQSSQRYLPEIDALRFFAIIPVMLVHFSAALLENNSNFSREIIDSDNALRNLLFQGNLGVDLFFGISGFILALPFINKKRNELKFKSYFLRRLVRIEPPYIIAITLFLFVHLFLQSETVGFLLERYFASFFYVHNIIYEYRSFILPVAWSLELEIQFYLLMPLLLYIFKIYESKYWRYLLYGSLALLSLTVNIFPFIELNDFMVYFIAGILVADLYKNNTFKKHFIWDIIFIISLPSFFLIKGSPEHLIRAIFLFLILASSLNLVLLKKILTHNLLVVIGGMCYSLYLLHYPFYHLMMKIFSDKLTFFKSFDSNFYLQAAIFIPLSILVITGYYLVVEKPFMMLSQKLGKK